MTNSNNRAAALAVAAVAAVLIATLVIVQMLGGDDEPETPAASDPATTAPVETPAAGECVEPPPLPASPQQFEEVPDQKLAEDAVWKATVSTNCGDIVMELDGTKAPQTVASFLFLARQGGHPSRRGRQRPVSQAFSTEMPRMLIGWLGASGPIVPPTPDSAIRSTMSMPSVTLPKIV